MNDRDKQFVEYWQEMLKRGRKAYMIRNIKVLFFTVIPVVLLVNLVQHGFSSSYVLSPPFMISLFLLIAWCILFGYGFSLFSWKSNQKRYERLSEK